MTPSQLLSSILEFDLKAITTNPELDPISSPEPDPEPIPSPEPEPDLVPELDPVPAPS
jgi:hypothetical protein